MSTTTKKTTKPPIRVIDHPERYERRCKEMPDHRVVALEGKVKKGDVFMAYGRLYEAVRDLSPNFVYPLFQKKQGSREYHDRSRRDC